MATVEEVRDEALKAYKKQAKHYANKIINMFDIEAYIEEDDEEYYFNYNTFIDDFSECDKDFIEEFSEYVENLKMCITEIKRLESI